MELYMWERKDWIMVECMREGMDLEKGMRREKDITYKSRGNKSQLIILCGGEGV